MPDVMNVVLAIIFTVAAFGCVGVFALGIFRGYEYVAQRALLRKYRDLHVHVAPEPDDVFLTYHTYHGLVAWISQTSHHVALPPDDARRLLGRLLRFNLTWGLLTFGILFIPPMAIYNYIAQRRWIARQEKEGLFNTPEPTPATVMPADDTKRPSAILRFAGWFCAILAVMCGISSIVNLVMGEFEAAVGGAIGAVILIWVASGWIGPQESPPADR